MFFYKWDPFVISSRGFVLICQFWTNHASKGSKHQSAANVSLEKTTDMQDLGCIVLRKQKLDGAYVSSLTGNRESGDIILATWRIILANRN